MREKSTKPIIFLMVIIAFLSIILLGYSVSEEHKHLHKKDKLNHIGFSGTYELDDSNIIEEFSDDTKLNAMKTKKVTLRGNFNKEIKSNDRLNLRIVNLKVIIYKNDRKIYSYGEEGTYPSFSKSAGNGWQGFVSDGINVDDDVKIELYSVYENNLSSAYNSFIEEIYKGDGNVLFQNILETKALKLFIAVLLVIMGLILLFTLIILWHLKVVSEYTPIQFAVFAIVSGLWVLIDFDVLSFVLPHGVFNLILYRIYQFMIVPLLLLYLLNFVEGKSRLVMMITEYVFLAFNLVYIIGQALGVYDGFDMLTAFNTLVIGTFIFNFGIVVYEIINNRNRDRQMLLYSVVILAIFSFWDIINYFIDIFPFNIGFSIGFIIFIIINFYYMILLIKENYLKVQQVQKIEKELIESRISVMMSQIQPHFLYNSLIAIQQLCDEDPAKAEEAIGNFAMFLRGNLDSLSTTKPIDFHKELNHVKTYLALEKMRFGNRLNIEYDIGISDFLIPSLTIQPLVENAVRYGISKKQGGGTILIKTTKSESEIIIIIKDDGLGFDTSKKPDDERVHIGISNVNNRLNVQTKGKLIIESIEGTGTTATIYIPREE